MEASINVGKSTVLARPYPNPLPWGEETSELNSTVSPPLGENLKEGRIFERNLTVSGEEEGLVLGNAGLVILWPFL